MKPAPLTDADLSQAMEEANFTFEPTKFARAIEAAVNAQWQAMLAKQEPVAWIESQEFSSGSYSPTYSSKVVVWTTASTKLPVGTKLYTTPPDHNAVMRQADKALGLIVQWHEAGFALTDHFVVRAKAAIAALKQALGEGE